jgi:hypothetical protein
VIHAIAFQRNAPLKGRKNDQRSDRCTIMAWMAGSTLGSTPRAKGLPGMTEEEKASPSARQC